MGRTLRSGMDDAPDEDIAAVMVAKWSFYPPERAITDKILSLSEDMGRSYRSKKRDKIFEAQKDRLFEEIEGLTEEEKKKIEKDMEDPGWYEKVFGAVSKVFFHNREMPLSPGKEGYSSFFKNYEYSDLQGDESSASFQKYVAEKMYDHLAMLTHSPRRKKFGDFSLRKEFTWGIAPDLGLGLYTREETSTAVREEVEKVLAELAGDFEDWFIYKKDEVLEATFGTICSLEHCVGNIEEVMRYSTLLIVATDVSEYGAAQTERLRAEWEEKLRARSEIAVGQYPFRGLVTELRKKKEVEAEAPAEDSSEQEEYIEAHY